MGKICCILGILMVSVCFGQPSTAAEVEAIEAASKAGLRGAEEAPSPNPPETYASPR